MTLSRTSLALAAVVVCAGARLQNVRLPDETARNRGDRTCADCSLRSIGHRRPGLASVAVDERERQARAVAFENMAGYM
jgi:hypothetical protein